MSLESMTASGELIAKKPVANEIQKLIEYVSRRLDDAGNESVHADARYEQAYNAILACATAALLSNSLRIRARDGHHLIAINSLEFTVGLDSKTIGFLNKIRRKRHKAIYEGSLLVPRKELDEVITKAHDIYELTIKYLASRGFSPPLFR